MWSNIGAGIREMLRNGEFPDIDSGDIAGSLGTLVSHYLGTLIFMGIVTTCATILLVYVVLAKCCSCSKKKKPPPKPQTGVMKIVVLVLLVLTTILSICGISALYYGQKTVHRSTRIFAASGASILADGGNLINTIQPVIDQALDYSMEEFSGIVGDLTEVIDEILKGMNVSVIQIVDQLGMIIWG
jgi:hypothetical protein